MLEPGLLGTLGALRKSAADRGAAQEVRNRIAPLVLRRRKADVAADLPARQDVVVRCRLGPAQRALRLGTGLTRSAGPVELQTLSVFEEDDFEYARRPQDWWCRAPAPHAVGRPVDLVLIPCRRSRSAVLTMCSY